MPFGGTGNVLDVGSIAIRKGDFVHEILSVAIWTFDV